MKYSRNSVWENKNILYISLIPYGILLLSGLYGGFIGFRWMDSYCVGLDGFIGAIEIMGLILLTMPMGLPILPSCLIYQIGSIVYRLRKKKKLKAQGNFEEFLLNNYNKTMNPVNKDK